MVPAEEELKNKINCSVQGYSMKLCLSAFSPSKMVKRKKAKKMSSEQKLLQFFFAIVTSIVFIAAQLSLWVQEA